MLPFGPIGFVPTLLAKFAFTSFAEVPVDCSLVIAANIASNVTGVASLPMLACSAYVAAKASQLAAP